MLEGRRLIFVSFAFFAVKLFFFDLESFSNSFIRLCG